VGFEQCAHAPCGADAVACDVDAVDADFADIRAQQAQQQFKRGGLAGTVAAEKTIHAAGGNGHRQIVHGNTAGEAAGQATGLDGGLHGDLDI